MLTPSQIAGKPNVMSIMVPDYDFEGQNRWDGTLMAGSYYTSNTLQTFDYQGTPCDAQGDEND